MRPRRRRPRSRRRRHAQAARQRRAASRRRRWASCSSGWCTPATAQRSDRRCSSASALGVRARSCFALLATPLLDAAEHAVGAGRCRPRLRPAGHGARTAGEGAPAPHPPRRCRTRSTCSSSASRPGSASIRRCSASARSSRSRIPELCDELRLINLELRAGKARAEALHNLARSHRCGRSRRRSSPMLVQTDKFGTSVAQSLRVHSETLRTKRRQRAEEAAAKTGVKMVFPLVVLHLPGDLGRDDRPGGDQVRPGPRSDGGRNERDADHAASPTIRRRSRRRRRCRATLEETGLPPISSSSCSSRRCTLARPPGSMLADRMRLPYSHPRAARRTHARASGWSRCAAHAAPARAGYRYALTDLGPRSRAAVPGRQPVHRPGAGAARRATSRTCARWPAARGYIDRERLREGLFAPDRRTTRARAARSGGERQQGGVPLRAARQRQDGDRRRHGPRARRRHVHAARHRHRRPDHHDVRPGQPRVARRRRAGVGERHRRLRRAIAAGSASGGRSSWSAAS